LTKKFLLSTDDINLKISEIESYCEIANINTWLISNALILKDRYKFSYFDSLIIASALENNCDILYSEDIQHNQIIEDKLKIINPFLKINM